MVNMQKLQTIMDKNHEIFVAGKRYSIEMRRHMLRELKKLILEKKERICAALYDDLGKSEFEATTSEIVPLLESINFLIKKLPSLAKTRRVPISSFNWPGRGRIMPEPYGQVLILGTWNYPLLLALDPLVGALAAGNRVVIKLSDQAPATMQILDEILSECFQDGEVTVADRDIDLESIASLKFDYIFFTGGRSAGQRVLELAAKNLTPVTLELGGKSPCIVDSNVDVKVAARRIVWGKFINAGQTCVAPDYLLVHRDVKAKLINELHECVRNFYGDDPLECKDYPRIVNETHFKRLEPLLAHGRLITGGEKNQRKLYIAPTIIDQITLEYPVMENEIFGPILPVIEVANMEEAIAIVNERPKPLALYFFGGRKNRNKVLQATSSGGVCVNETVMHLMNGSMPFGGIGDSGMGAYHGKYSFSTFSHERPILLKGTWFDPPLRYIPFTSWKQWVANLFVK